MTTRQKLIDHLAELEQAREKAFKQGQWARVDDLQMCIDDTRDDIKALKLTEVNREKFIGVTLVHAGHAWRVIGVGAQRDGNTFCHLSNLYQFRQQKNGRVPVQINDWVDTAVLNTAASARDAKVAA